MISASSKAAQGPQSGSYVTTDTYANISLLTSYPVGTRARVSDVGLYGSDFVYTGSRWVPINGQCVLAQLALPVVKAPTFTGTTNGAITLGTATPQIYSKCYMYFPANSLLAAQAAGFYYVEMSSTTAGVVYNNTYTPAGGTYPTEPTSKTAFSGAVPGGTGLTTEVTAFIVTVAAGLLGLFGVLKSQVMIDVDATAGSKIIYQRLAGGSNTGDTLTTASLMGEAYVRNSGRASEQRYNTTFSAEVFSGGVGRATINTAAAFDISVTLRTSSAATDIAALLSYSIVAEIMQ